MVDFTCPKCRIVTSVPDYLAGQKTVCPECQSVGHVFDPAITDLASSHSRKTRSRRHHEDEPEGMSIATKWLIGVGIFFLLGLIAAVGEKAKNDGNLPQGKIDQSQATPPPSPPPPPRVPTVAEWDKMPPHEQLWHCRQFVKSINRDDPQDKFAKALAGLLIINAKATDADRIDINEAMRMGMEIFKK